MITSTTTPRSKSTAPVYVTDIAREVKAVDGIIWQTGKSDFGFFILAEVSGLQLRIIIAKPGQPAPANDKGILTHIVTTMEALSDFLTSLTAEPTQK